jgi:hypothetical protein
MMKSTSPSKMHTFRQVSDDMELHMVDNKQQSIIQSLSWQDLGVSVKSRSVQRPKVILTNAWGIARPGA